MRKSKWICVLAILGSLRAADAQTRAPAGDSIEGHIAAGKNSAGGRDDTPDFYGLVTAICIAPLNGPPRADAPAPRPNPNRESTYLEPKKAFDDLYWMGTQSRSSWALTTSDGIILYDTHGVYDSEALIVGGLKKLGLDPAKVKYVIISHAHLNEVGGAKLMQERYGARIVMGAGDWDLVDESVNGFPTGKPKRDIVATDGMKITLGGRTVTIWTTPGHTPGTISYTFTALDHGRTVNIAYSGGTAFNFVNNTPSPGIRNFQTYIDSQKKMAQKAAAVHATVLLSNHSEFDDAYNRNRMLAGRGNGPHPYEVGEPWVQRYFNVTQGCARAAQIRLEQRQATATN
jgi:metallo-beta-lactamase class B